MAISPPQDEWLRRFHAGERDALSSFYRDHFAAVQTAVGRILHGFDQETVIHDVFLRLVSDRGLRERFTGGSAHAWIVQIARNAAIDAWRREHKRTDAPQTLEGEWTQEVTLARAEAAAELRQVMEGFRAHLPDKWKAVFDVRFIEELDQREAAKRLGIARTTLAYRELRIRAELEKFVLRGEAP